MTALPSAAFTIASALGLAIREHNRRLSQARDRCRDKLRAKHVHDLRTAARKLLVALQLAEALDAPSARKAPRNLRRLMRVLAPLRALQVQLKGLDPSTLPPDAADLVAALQRKKRQRRRHVDSGAD